VGRNFWATQLWHVEDDLEGVARVLSDLAIEVGEHSDAIHFDGVEPRSHGEALRHVRELTRILQTVEGLLHAYEIALAGREYAK
jgi:hypothetical protein